MDKAYLTRERDFYLRQLLENVLPFWLHHARDEECGGYYTCLRRDGSVFDADKVTTWNLGRVAWSFAHLYNHLRPEPEWLKMALHGVKFLRTFCLDGSGHLWGAVTREGRPLAKATDAYHDLFAAQALVECWKATGERDMLTLAQDLAFAMAAQLANPDTSPYRLYLPSARPLRAQGEDMILLETMQLMRTLDDDPRYDEVAARCVRNILSCHYSARDKAVFELARADGAVLPRWMGRWVSPGHMCELVWLFIGEGLQRRNEELVAQAVTIADGAMEWGWDEQHPGMPNDVNIDGEFCCSHRLFPYANLILWWQNVEAIRANLQAYLVTREPRFLDRYEQVRDWSFKHFADREHGEWFGVLSPEGRLLDAGAKATDIKGCQHLVRTFYNCYRLLEREAGKA